MIMLYVINHMSIQLSIPLATHQPFVVWMHFKVRCTHRDHQGHYFSIMSLRVQYFSQLISFDISFTYDEMHES